MPRKVQDVHRYKNKKANLLRPHRYPFMEEWVLRIKKMEPGEVLRFEHGVDYDSKSQSFYITLRRNCGVNCLLDDLSFEVTNNYVYVLKIS